MKESFNLAKKLIFMFIIICFAHTNAYSWRCDALSGENRFQVSDEDLFNCSWITNGTGAIVDVVLKYSDSKNYDFYRHVNHKSYKKDRNYSYFFDLSKKIEKSIFNNLYFTDIKYVDYNSDIFNKLNETNYMNPEDWDLLEKLHMERIVHINIDIDIYKYNKTTNLHYGLLNLTISSRGNYSDTKWRNGSKYYPELYNDSTTFKYEIPFAGYKNKDKILQKNIIEQIDSWVGSKFRKSYTSISNKLNDTKVIKLDNLSKYLEPGVFSYFLDLNKVDIEIEKDKPLNDLYFDTWKFTKETTDEEIRKEINKGFDKLYNDLFKYRVQQGETLRKDFSDLYFPFLKKIVKER